MFQEMKHEVKLVRILLILLIIAVGSYVFSIFWQVLSSYSDILIILLSAWLLSFILEPIVDRISAISKLNKVWATLITYLLTLVFFSAIIFLFIPTVAYQIQTLAQIIPEYSNRFPQFLSRWNDAVATSLDNSIDYLPSVAQFFFSLFILLIISFYFIVDKERINKEIFILLPNKWHDEIRFVQKVVGDVFASFLRVQLIFGIVTGIITWIVLTLLGIDFAASSSLLSGILAIIPLVGPLLSILPPLFVAFIVDPTRALIAVILLLIAQQFIFNVLGPKLLGRAFKVHPAIILVSFLIGFKVAGAAGMFLAVPIVGILAVILRELSHHYFKPNKE